MTTIKMTTASVICGGLLAPTAEQELDLPSKQLGRGNNITPKHVRSDAICNLFAATPLGSQRTCYKTVQSGAHTCDGAGGDFPPTHQTTRDKTNSLRLGSEDIRTINKDLLVIALEEENDRLRSALESERRARKRAETEANLEKARARGHEEHAKELTLQLAEAQEKLAELERAALSRALVQAWLDTATPQRRGSVDLGPEKCIEVGSAVLTEPVLCAKLATESVLDATESVPTPTGPGTVPALEVNAGGDARGVSCTLQAGEFGKQFDAHLSSESDKFGPRADRKLLDCRDSLSMRMKTRPKEHDYGCGCCSTGGSLPANGSQHGMALLGSVPSLLPPHTHCHVGRLMDPSGDAGGIPIARPFPTERSMQRTCTVGHGVGRNAGADLGPSWSLPVSGENPLPPFLLLLQGDSPRASVAPPPTLQGKRLLFRAGSSPLAANGIPAHAVAAANIWLPAGAALCHSWGFNESPCRAAELSPRQLSATSAFVPLAASSSAPNCPLADTYVPPTHSLQRHHSHHYTHHYHYSDPHQMLGTRSASIRIATESSSPRRMEAPPGGAFSLGSASGPCGCDGAGGSVQSCGSAVPVGVQDGGEWCNIPLGSPECTPTKECGGKA